VAKTLVVSDLHLGARREPDVLRRPGPRAALCEAASRCERLVLLGDVVELRHDPARSALRAAEPVLRELGEALAPGSEVVIVPGNHDHMLLRAWLGRRGLDSAGPLGLAAEVDWREDEALAELAGWLAPASVSVRYPGVWLRRDVYATHGHYGDRHITIPILERLGAAVMAKVVAEPPGGPGSAEAYESVLGPMYAWIDAVAQGGGVRGRGGGGLQVRAWRALQRSEGGRGLRGAGLRAALPAAVAVLNRLGMGPLRPDVSGPALRRGGLRAFAEVLERLEVRADHVVFGHTHRAGPLPGDEPSEWRTSGGARLLNTGCWVGGGSFLGGEGGRSPYRPGFAARLDDHGPPALVNLLD